MAINPSNPYSLALSGQNLVDPSANIERLRALIAQPTPAPTSGGRRAPAPTPAAPAAPETPPATSDTSVSEASTPPMPVAYDRRDFAGRVKQAQQLYDENSKAADLALLMGQITPLQRRRIDERYRNELGYLNAMANRQASRDRLINQRRAANAAKKASRTQEAPRPSAQAPTQAPTQVPAQTPVQPAAQDTRLDRVVNREMPTMQDILAQSPTGLLMDLASRPQVSTMADRPQVSEAVQMPAQPEPAQTAEPARQPFDPTKARQFTDQEMADFAQRYLTGYGDAATTRAQTGRVSVGGYLNELAEVTTGYRPFSEFGYFPSRGDHTGLYDSLVATDVPGYPSITEGNIDAAIRQGPIGSMNPIAREALKDRLRPILRELSADLPHQGRHGFPSEAAVYEDRLRQLMSAVGPGMEQNILKLILAGPNPNLSLDPLLARLTRTDDPAERRAILDQMQADPLYTNPKGETSAMRLERLKAQGADPLGASLMMPGTEQNLGPLADPAPPPRDPYRFYSPETMAIRRTLPPVITPTQASEWQAREIANANAQIARDEAAGVYGDIVFRGNIRDAEIAAANRQIDFQEAGDAVRSLIDPMGRMPVQGADATGPLAELARIRRIRQQEQRFGPRPMDYSGEFGPVRPPAAPWMVGGSLGQPF